MEKLTTSCQHIPLDTLLLTAYKAPQSGDPDLIIRTVVNHFKLETRLLMEGRGKREYSDARKIIAVLIRHNSPKMKPGEITGLLGKDRSCYYYYMKTFDELMLYDKSFKRSVTTITGEVEKALK
jgi:chromosomal replication initiation ATPase DnaA